MDGSAERAADRVGEQANENDVTVNSSDSDGAGDTAKNPVRLFPFTLHALHCIFFQVETAAVNEPSTSSGDMSGQQSVRLFLFTEYLI